MMRRLPVIPTLLVLVAVGVMIRLGFWQLDRLHQKEALLARYASAHANPEIVDWDGSPEQGNQYIYRRARIHCLSATGDWPVAGRSRSGQPGWVQRSLCAYRKLGKSSYLNATVVLGWSKDVRADGGWPEADSPIALWAGKEATGWIAPGPRLVADPPLAGLAANARPDPADISNNHLAYAVQWFLFAATALVIYGIAVRRGMKGK